MTMIKAGVYVHIPFCRKKCAYCDFLSHVPTPLEIERYIEALELEIERFRVEGLTLFVGGGTPSVVPPSLMAVLIDRLQKAYGPFQEATIEVNPGTVDLEYLQMLKEKGIDRLSIGVQSFDDETLQKMGRIHTAAEAVKTVDYAVSAGFENVSIDVIYAYPGTTMQSLEKTLQIASGLPVTHISYYGLQLEEGTELFRVQPEMLSDSEYVEMYFRGIETLENAGFVQYEISNFAKPSYQCKHNLIYWKNQEYLGLGVGAVGRLGRVRYRNTEVVEEYIRSMHSGAIVQSVEEELTDELMLQENIMLGLRLREGVGPEDLGGSSLRELFPEAVVQLEEAGFLEEIVFRGTKRFRLTRKALPVMNSVVGYFFD